MIALRDAVKDHTAHWVQVHETAEANTSSVVCEICGDAGFVVLNVPVDDPRFGKAYPCPNPQCPVRAENQRQRQHLLLKKSHWVEDYQTMTFETWGKVVGERDAWKGKIGAYCAAVMFAEQAGKPFQLQEAAAALGQTWPNLKADVPRCSLVLTGTVGVGKTGLAVGVANTLFDRGEQVLFLRVQDLIREVQETYRQSDDDSGPTAENKLALIRTARVLILDEFALKNYTRDRLEIMEDILRARDKAGLPFMATTNLSLDEFYALWEPQIADIVAKAHWISMGGTKLRDTVQHEVDSF